MDHGALPPGAREMSIGDDFDEGRPDDDRLLA